MGRIVDHTDCSLNTMLIIIRCQRGTNDLFCSSHYPDSLHLSSTLLSLSSEENGCGLVTENHTIGQMCPWESDTVHPL